MVPQVEPPRLRLAAPPRPPQEVAGAAAGHDAAPGAARGQCGSSSSDGLEENHGKTHRKTRKISKNHRKTMEKWENQRENHMKMVVFHGISNGMHPLVMTHMAKWKITMLSMGKST